MLEILAVIAAASGIAALARGRGGKPWLWAGLAVAGWIIIPFTIGMARAAVGQFQPTVWYIVAGWAWIGAVALWARFGLGAGRAKPGGMWVCPNCKMLNKNYAVICEACQQPYANMATPGKNP